MNRRLVEQYPGINALSWESPLLVKQAPKTRPARRARKQPQRAQKQPDKPQPEEPQPLEEEEEE
ncbi:hypothetical protein NW762_007358 [Fusarium torreyae]|uniref:Uncharacterized protein n=1 Tax=Fusarium torreyae TaxID=1237075 RepID=A0A9W8S0K7_9HYPO|nr:hypothetical protein NW762_007358 [Fusarium torreyae]